MRIVVNQHGDHYAYAVCAVGLCEIDVPLLIGSLFLATLLEDSIAYYPSVVGARPHVVAVEDASRSY